MSRGRQRLPEGYVDVPHPLTVERVRVKATVVAAVVIKSDLVLVCRFSKGATRRVDWECASAEVLQRVISHVLGADACRSELKCSAPAHLELRNVHRRRRGS